MQTPPITITIGNSLSTVTNLPAAIEGRLKEELSYTEAPGAQFYGGGHRPRSRPLIDRNGRFPTGLLIRALTLLYNSGVPYVVNDLRTRPEARQGLFDIRLGVSPYPEQEAAARAAQAASRGICSMPTGTGKSVVIALIIQKLQVPTLVVVPSLELKRQLSESLRECFGRDKVGKGKPIWVENVDALDPKKVLTGYDAVILDEFHRSASATYRKLSTKAWVNVYYRLAATATPFRSQDHEQILLESVLSEVIYELDYRTAVAKGYICPLEFYSIELPKAKVVEGYTWAQVYSELVVNNDYRNDVIATTMVNAMLQGKSVLTLVKQIEHGEIIQAKIQEKYDLWVPFAKGEGDDKSEVIAEFSKGRIRGLIGTTGVVGEGVDTKAAEYVIIAGLGKSKNAFMQQCGRCVRRYGDKKTAKIVLFKDSSHKWTKAHFAAQKKYAYDEYGVKVIAL